MDTTGVPILADGIREYSEDSELLELCGLFDVQLEYEGDRVAHMRLARKLLTEPEHGNNREDKTNKRPFWGFSRYR